MERPEIAHAYNSAIAAMRELADADEPSLHSMDVPPNSGAPSDLRASSDDCLMAIARFAHFGYLVATKRMLESRDELGD